jgi:hypothetical protein
VLEPPLPECAGRLASIPRQQERKGLWRNDGWAESDPCRAGTGPLGTVLGLRERQAGQGGGSIVGKPQQVGERWRGESARRFRLRAAEHEAMTVRT